MAILILQANRQLLLFFLLLLLALGTNARYNYPKSGAVCTKTKEDDTCQEIEVKRVLSRHRRFIAPGARWDLMLGVEALFEEAELFFNIVIKYPLDYLFGGSAALAGAIAGNDAAATASAAANAAAQAAVNAQTQAAAAAAAGKRKKRWSFP